MCSRRRRNAWRGSLRILRPCISRFGRQGFQCDGAIGRSGGAAVGPAFRRALYRYGGPIRAHHRPYSGTENFAFYRPILSCGAALALRNAVSTLQPKWICWDEDERDLWVREMPEDAICAANCPWEWFHKGMEFESCERIRHLVPPEKGVPIACGIGIRADESLKPFFHHCVRATQNGAMRPTLDHAHCRWRLQFLSHLRLAL